MNENRDDQGTDKCLLVDPIPTDPGGAATLNEFFRKDDRIWRVQVKGMVQGRRTTRQLRAALLEIATELAATSSVRMHQQPDGNKHATALRPRLAALRMLAMMLPSEDRTDYLEEQHAYLLDLPNYRARFRWVLNEVRSVAQQAFIMRKKTTRERA